MLLARHVALLAALSTLPFVPASAQYPGNSRVQTPGNVALSPDGTTVAWTLRARDGSTLHLTNLAGGAEKTISPDGKCSSSEPVWSPDGETLAFLAACTEPSTDPTVPRQSQIFLWGRKSGQTRQLTHLKGDLNQLAWSPDGKSIAFLFVENATRTAGALDAMKPWAGVIGEDGVEVQRVYAVNAAADSTSGNGSFLTSASLHVYEFDWAPSSNQIAFVAANPPGENNWWVAKLYKARVDQLLHPASGPVTGINTCVYDSAKRCFLEAPIFDPASTQSAMRGLQIAVPRYSPDGKHIALIGGLMSDQGSTGGDVWVLDARGGEPVDITPGMDGTACFEGWVNDHAVGFVEDRRGHILLPDYDINTHAMVPGSSVDLGGVSVSGGAIKDAVSYTRDGVFAFVKQSLTAPPEVWAGPLDKLKQLTHLNEGVKVLARTESVEWENEGFHVQGWLTFPANYDPAKRYPLIVQVHGGPSSSIGPRFSGSMFASAGYFEFQPNPRGSFGQGEAFTQANRKDFGYGDLRDILKGMDVIEAKYPIDKTREGLTGWSYGGFMTMFAVTQTHRFRAAVAGAGLSDWESYYGENSIDQWMIPFFGASVYDDPAVYAKSSAMTFIKQAKTPTLVIVGDRDGECPAPQSFEFWHALRDLGVKTQLVVYPDEGHGFRSPDHIRDRNEREIRWFAENMPETKQVAKQ